MEECIIQSNTHACRAQRDGLRTARCRIGAIATGPATPIFNHHVKLQQVEMARRLTCLVPGSRLSVLSTT